MSDLSDERLLDIAERWTGMPADTLQASAATMAREILRRREAERWRPIETAPKDGTQILGCAISAPEYDPSVTAFVNDEWQTSDLDDGQYVPATWTEAISHWRPLPTPPEAT